MAVETYAGLASTTITPAAADTYNLGSTTREWLSAYIGDAGFIYFGLSQDIALSRLAANILGLAAGDLFAADELLLDAANRDIRLYRSAADTLALGNGDSFVPGADTGGNLGSASLRWGTVFGAYFTPTVGIDISANAVYIRAQGADNGYAVLQARDNGVGYAEIARLVGAAEPRFGYTLPLNLRSPAARTIATGAITIGVAAAGAWYTVDTEAAAATDDLDTVSGLATGDIIFLKAANSARTVVIKHNTGNIQCNGLADFSLDNANDVWAGIYDGVNLLEILRSSNGA